MKKGSGRRKNLDGARTYAYELVEQKETLGFLVADNKFTRDHLEDVAVDFLYEMSWFGYEQENLQEFKDGLDESIRESEEHPENLVKMEDIEKEWDLPEEEEYPEEDERAREVYEAERGYVDYCRNVELGRLKEAILDSRSMN